MSNVYLHPASINGRLSYALPEGWLTRIDYTGNRIQLVPDEEQPVFCVTWGYDEFEETGYRLTIDEAVALALGRAHLYPCVYISRLDEQKTVVYYNPGSDTSDYPGNWSNLKC